MTEQLEQPERARRETGGTSSARRQLYLAGIPVLVALASLITAITGHVQSCSAKVEAGEAKEVAVEAKEAGEVGEKLAKKTAAGAAQDYANIKGKLDPTADVAATAATAATECATKAEVAALRKQLNEQPLAWVRGRAKAVPKKPAPPDIPPAVKEDLPDQSAAAAAASPGGQ